MENDNDKILKMVGDVIKTKLSEIFNCNDVEIKQTEIVVPLHYHIVTSEQLKAVENMGFKRYLIDIVTEQPHMIIW